MTIQLERTLQIEIGLRLNRYPVVWCAVPNGVYIPARDLAERDIAARIVNRMKADGALTPGAPDMVIAGAKGVLMTECKRPRTRDLLTVRPAGRLSPEQREFRDRCERAGVRYVVAHSWDDVESGLEGLW